MQTAGGVPRAHTSALYNPTSRPPHRRWTKSGITRPAPVSMMGCFCHESCEQIM